MNEISYVNADIVTKLCRTKLINYNRHRFHEFPLSFELRIASIIGHIIRQIFYAHGLDYFCRNLQTRHMLLNNLTIGFKLMTGEANFCRH